MNDTGELHPPRPGGMVDSARQRAVQADEGHGDEPVPVEVTSEITAVPVDLVGPDQVSARTYVLATGGVSVSPVLGKDKQRRRAVIITLDQPVVITSSRAAADDPRNASNAAGLPASGFVLPINTPLIIWSRAQVFAAATSATATRVSVLSETRAPA